jgi:hypothetical protein
MQGQTIAEVKLVDKPSREVRGEDFGSLGTVASTAVHADGTFVIEHVPPG